MHFGLPSSIISNHNCISFGDFLHALWELMDAKLKRSNVIHPKTYGYKNVVNSNIIQFWQIFNHKNTKIWDVNIPYAQHNYNHEEHSASGTSSLQEWLGILLKDPFTNLRPIFEATMANEIVAHEQAIRFNNHIQKIYDQVQEALDKSQQKHKAKDDQHYIHHQFHTRDRV